MARLVLAGHMKGEDMVYQWKGRQYNVSADVVGKEVEKIEKRDGEITARSLVDAARSEKSALHKLFEWDNKKAADSWRLHQASVIICSLSVVCDDMQDPTTIRAFMNVADDCDNPTRRTGSFINMKNAFSDPEKRELILRCAIREFREIQKKYSNLKELKELFDVIDKL